MIKLTHLRVLSMHFSSTKLLLLLNTGLLNSTINDTNNNQTITTKQCHGHNNHDLNHRKLLQTPFLIAPITQQSTTKTNKVASTKHVHIFRDHKNNPQTCFELNNTSTDSLDFRKRSGDNDGYCIPEKGAGTVNLLQTRRFASTTKYLFYKEL